MKQFILIVLMFCSIAVSMELPEDFQIIPHPQEVQVYGQESLFCKEIQGIFLDDDIELPVLPFHLSALPLLDNQTDKSLVLTKRNADELEGNSEGYILEINARGISILAIDDAGFFYACQTLEQMIEDAKTAHIGLPACRILDVPAYEWRAVHFDVKHHLDHMNYYYESIDRLAKYKINAIVFEFENKLRYQKRPLVGSSHAISIEEMQALSQYAADRHIEIIPLVQGLGHATFILKHEKYVPLREQEDNKWAFCPLNPETYDVLFDLYLDAMEATPNTKYFHVGGDEVGSIGICDRCKGYGQEYGQLGLNLYWLNKVCEFIREQGRIPIYWDDMLFKEADLWKSVQRDGETSPEETAAMWEKGLGKLNAFRSKLPNDAVFMRWNYDNGDSPGSGRALDFYIDQHLPAVIATAAQTTNTLVPGLERTTTIKRFTEFAHEHGINGSLCTAWDDSSPLMELYWRGWVTSAEYTWAPGKRSMDEFETAMFQREFGLNRFPVYETLAPGTEFWDRSYFKSGTRRSRSNAMVPIASASHWTSNKKIEYIENNEKFIALPNPEKPGEWRKQNREKLDKAKELVNSDKNTQALLKKMYNNASRNRYGIEVLMAIHELQSTAPRMFLAMAACDVANKTKRVKGFEQIKIEREKFEKAAENLERVYGKIRFLSNPDGYVPDRYFHWASQAEDISFMFQVERGFHQCLDEWMSKN